MAGHKVFVRGEKLQMMIYAKLQSSSVRHQYGIFGSELQTSFMYDLSITPLRITTVILHTFAMLYRTLSLTSNTLSWTKASACQTVAVVSWF